MWNRIGTLGLNGPVFTATDGTKATGLQGLTRKQRGRDPGFVLAPCTATFGRRVPT
jgi:hypothetical protein